MELSFDGGPNISSAEMDAFYTKWGIKQIIIIIIIESIPRLTINIQDLRTRVNVDTSAILSSQEGEYKSL